MVAGSWTVLVGILKAGNRDSVRSAHLSGQVVGCDFVRYAGRTPRPEGCFHLLRAGILESHNGKYAECHVGRTNSGGARVPGEFPPRLEYLGDQQEARDSKELDARHCPYARAPRICAE